MTPQTTYAVNGSCGNLDGKKMQEDSLIDTVNDPDNESLLCDWGNSNNIVTTNSASVDWTCGDNNVGCSAEKSAFVVHGTCGFASALHYSNGPPSSELCLNDPDFPSAGGIPDPSTPILAELVDGEYRWECLGYGNNNPVHTTITWPANTADPGTTYYVDGETTYLCHSGSQSKSPACDECKENTSHPNCRQHYQCYATYVPPACADDIQPTYEIPTFDPNSNTRNLCKFGKHTNSDETTSSIVYNSSADQYEWYCRGDGGLSSQCVAPKMYKGDCEDGTAHGDFYINDTQPSTGERCGGTSEGDINYTFDSGTNTYTWNCKGKNGGDVSSQCSATRVKCGSNGDPDAFFGDVNDIFVADNCAGGTSSAIDDSDSYKFQWTCSGTGGTPAVSCEAEKLQNGDCGLADGGTYAARPSNGDLCDIGSAQEYDGGNWVDSFKEAGDSFTWTCGGPELNGGTPDTSCSANIQRTGVCGNEGFDRNAGLPESETDLKAVREISDLSPDGLCSVGELTEVFPDSIYTSIDGDTYEWGCNGINNGAGIGCAVNIIKPAVCDPSSDDQDLVDAPISGARCSEGQESGVEEIDDLYSWDCDGPFGGEDTTCGARIKIHGECGSAESSPSYDPPEEDLCNKGIEPGEVDPGSGFTNPPVTTTGEEYTWICAGQHNGDDSEVCKTYITKDGECDPASHEQDVNTAPSSEDDTPGLCINGAPTNLDPDITTIDTAVYDPNTLTYTWDCVGVHGGINTGEPGGNNSCVANKTTDAVCGPATEDNYYFEEIQNEFDTLVDDQNPLLCEPGLPVELSPIDNDTPTDYTDDSIKWDCGGLNSGADAENCQAVRKYDGVCGTAHTTLDIYEYPPLESELCEKGVPSILSRTPDHRYEWTCSGINGGIVSETCDAEHDGAIGSIQSGIDRSTSYIQVDYTPPGLGGAAVFRCFEQNNTSYRAFFDKSPLQTVNLNSDPLELFSTDCLKQVGDYVFELFIVDIAGNESPDNGVYSIEVLPGEIDQTQSLWNDCEDELNFDPEGIEDSPPFPSLIANGLDSCVFNLTLRDSQQNIVTSIPENAVTMNSPTTNDTFIENPIANLTAANPIPWGDANLETGFREGLRIDAPNDPIGSKVILPDANSFMFVPDRDGDASNGLDFQMSSIAPSMLKLGEHAGAAAAGILSFNFSVPDIDDFGRVDTGAPSIVFSLPTPLFFYPMIRLQPNLMTYIDHLGYEQYAVFADSPIPIDNELSEYSNRDGSGDRLVNIGEINAWLYTSVPESDSDPNVSTIDFDGMDINIKNVDTTLPVPDGNTDSIRYGYGWGPENAQLNRFDSPDGSQGMTSEINALLEEEDLSTSDFENQIYTSSAGYAGQEVNLVTNVKYSISDPADPTGEKVLVSYPGGFLGSAKSLGFDQKLLPDGQFSIIGNDTLFYFRFVGASIEGGVIGSLERLSLSGTELVDTDQDTYSTVIATGLSANEAREAMRSQAFELINGQNPEVCGNSGEVIFQSLIDSGAWDDKDVVYVQGCDVRVEEDVQDPTPPAPEEPLDAEELKRYNYASSSLATLMPGGQKTLVIQNGNLFIDNDMWYQDWITDSFGIIVFNDALEPYPAEGGNLFVKSSVKRMVGSYYVAGAIFGTQEDSTPAGFYNYFDPQEPDEESDANTGPTLEDDQNYPDLIANTAEGNNASSAKPGAEISTFLQEQVEKYNRNQLILHGTVLSYNTLGGFHIWHSKIPIEGAPTNYFTSWNVMDSTNDEENAAVAIQYDLHYLRRFNVHDWGTGKVCDEMVPSLGVCLKDENNNGITDYIEDLDGDDFFNNSNGDPTPDGIPDGDGKADYSAGGFDSARCTPDLNDILQENTPVKCDPNPNAFILRNDQKVSKYPPPGFDVVGNMDLTQD